MPPHALALGADALITSAHKTLPAWSQAALLAAGIPLEMADRDVLVPMVTLSDDEPSVARLVDTLVSAIEKHRGEPRKISAAALNALQATLADGGRIAYAADPTLTTIQVIAS